MTFAKIIFTFAFSLFAFSFFVPTAHAVTYEDIQQQGIIFAGICPAGDPAITTCECRDTGNCSIDDILQVFVNVATFILGISGSLVLLMFVYGGVLWLTSGGNENQVKQGKDILAGSAIGLAIIFGSYVAISVVISALKTGSVQTNEPLEDITGTDVFETETSTTP